MTPRLGQSLVFAAGALSGLHLRFGFWRAAAELRVELPEGSRPAEQVLLRGMETYARGLRALEMGKLTEAERTCEALDALSLSLAEERKGDGRLLCPRDVARVVELAGCELRGALESRQGDPARAEATLIRAMRLERRLRGAGPSPSPVRPARHSPAPGSALAARTRRSIWPSRS
ncbi:hypothetical protein ACN28S_35165 [Cystobacter fuscus]